MSRSFFSRYKWELVVFYGVLAVVLLGYMLAQQPPPTAEERAQRAAEKAQEDSFDLSLCRVRMSTLETAKDTMYFFDEWGENAKCRPLLIQQVRP